MVEKKVPKKVIQLVDEIFYCQAAVPVFRPTIEQLLRQVVRRRRGGRQNTQAVLDFWVDILTDISIPSDEELEEARARRETGQGGEREGGGEDGKQPPAPPPPSVQDGQPPLQLRNDQQLPPVRPRSGSAGKWPVFHEGEKDFDELQPPKSGREFVKKGGPAEHTLSRNDVEDPAGPAPRETSHRDDEGKGVMANDQQGQHPVPQREGSRAAGAIAHGGPRADKRQASPGPGSIPKSVRPLPISKRASPSQSGVRKLMAKKTKGQGKFTSASKVTKNEHPGSDVQMGGTNDEAWCKRTRTWRCALRLGMAASVSSQPLFRKAKQNAKKMTRKAGVCSIPGRRTKGSISVTPLSTLTRGVSHKSQIWSPGNGIWR